MSLVVKLAQPGFNANTAGDQNLVFSSEFPVLKEHMSGVFDIGTYQGLALQSIYEHNLGYTPFFLVFDPQGQFVLGSNWAVDETKLYFVNSSPALTGVYRWIIYRLDLFTNYEAPALDVQFANIGGSDDKFVIKISKEGKDIYSDDLRDFSIHSRARSPLIHKVDAKIDWKEGGFTVDNHLVASGLPYSPIAFGFARTASVAPGTPRTTRNLISGGQSAPKLSRNFTTKEINIQAAGLSCSKSSIVIFKDPILAPEIITVNY
ncbi:hypothetical protein UFOVP1522_13 [uncultured Caudovirales phage]|uniref:Uncharacterized protein n=1 Tax=uncultured Caudovirales phage TaxID=2100421 RepID=A0A6J5QL28_9CAUD|nr:hypothetical protein UFOVP989_10 [uncultured Caudovirales phage]CAB4181648.1 hypothetical protein UFOVP1075_56 [uncultured Caudovirales phage]CAB4198757.1 hypothetical protein UFOVP1312_48 [uncultured Caudovirales phage]CAB4210430.1 hypothetical protein UFOVP1426_10 [uncultured Caudovirales phage]CAB5227202.1 hypothetical protein UFOVP1522_13 [uncultured Caudovirales phage]